MFEELILIYDMFNYDMFRKFTGIRIGDFILFKAVIKSCSFQVIDNTSLLS